MTPETVSCDTVASSVERIAAPAAAESPVCAFLRNPSMVEYPGRLAAMFFVSGCNFRCGFCHNAVLMGKPQRGMSWDKLRRACGKFSDLWVDAAVVSGGEPTLSPDLVPLLRLFKDRGWAVKLDTNGSNPAVLRECLPFVDYVAMDVKTSLPMYPFLTGHADTECIAESIRLILDEAPDYEFRTTVIEPLHTTEQMQEIGLAIRGAVRYVLQPFVPRDSLPDPAFRAIRRTSPDRLQELQSLLRPYVRDVTLRGN
jgi:pyruvate formate lyase activating enzyme